MHRVHHGRTQPAGRTRLGQQGQLGTRSGYLREGLGYGGRIGRGKSLRTEDRQSAHPLDATIGRVLNSLWK